MPSANNTETNIWPPRPEGFEATNKAPMTAQPVQPWSLNRGGLRRNRQPVTRRATNEAYVSLGHGMEGDAVRRSSYKQSLIGS
jgi:hypothetical protein